MSPKNGALIKLDGVGKTFYTDEVETHALSNIHLAIKAGEYLAIAGPSGCGKSTLLAILGLLDSPSNGTYLLKGEPVESLTLAERARVRNREIGFIFQAFNLIGDRLSKRGTASDLSKYAGSRPEKESARGARSCGDVAPHEAFSLAAFWRSATTCGRRASAGRQSIYSSC